MSPKIYLTGAAGTEVFSRLHQKCFSATQGCLPPPKNVTFHPRMFGCHPKIVLLHPKMFWVHPKRFRAPKLFLGLPRVLLSVGDLFDRIRVTMPADRPGSVPRQEIVDILAHMLNANQFQ